MTTHFTPLQELWAIGLALDLWFLTFSTLYTIRGNQMIGFLPASDKKLQKVRAWFEKRGGYNTELHSGCFAVMFISFLVLVILMGSLHYVFFRK